jgi:transcriptional regulator with XRE-family HTH domain
MMKISEQIKVLCVRTNVSTAELARRLGQSPQNLNAKLKRESFTIAELERIAEAVDAKFERNFVLSNGEKVKGDE